MSNSFDDDFKFDLDKDVKIDVELELKLDVEIKKDVEIDVKIDADADVKGNIAEVVFDAQAFGDDTFVQADIFTIAIEDTMSSASGYVVSAVG